jgi:hypothetical protein
LINLICHDKRADRVAKEDGKEKEGYAMNLKTSYLGMKLRTPLVPSASPLSESLDGIKRMEEGGRRNSGHRKSEWYDVGGVDQLRKANRTSGR